MFTAGTSLSYKVSLTLQALFYIVQGLVHFLFTSSEVRVMPTHYSHPYELVILSGIAEMAGGVGLLLPQTRRSAAWGLILLLLIYFDVHVYMVVHAQQFPSVPLWALYLRLPLQFLLLVWAAVYARPHRKPPQAA